MIGYVFLPPSTSFHSPSLIDFHFHLFKRERSKVNWAACLRRGKWVEEQQGWSEIHLWMNGTKCVGAEEPPAHNQQQEREEAAPIPQSTNLHSSHQHFLFCVDEWRSLCCWLLHSLTALPLGAPFNQTILFPLCLLFHQINKFNERKTAAQEENVWFHSLFHCWFIWLSCLSLFALFGGAHGGQPPITPTNSQRPTQPAFINRAASPPAFNHSNQISLFSLRKKKSNLIDCFRRVPPNARQQSNQTNQPILKSWLGLICVLNGRAELHWPSFFNQPKIKFIGWWRKGGQ